MGEISVYFKRLDYLGDSTYFHEFIVWTNDQGTQLVLRGGPKSRFGFNDRLGGGSGDSGLDQPGSGINFPFGSLDGVLPPTLLRTSRDLPTNGTVDPSQMIINGPDSKLRSYWNAMLTEAEKIDNEDIGYAAGVPNSNTYVTTLLQAAGLPLVKYNGLNDALPAPGADMSLIGNHYSALRGYAELAENALERGFRDVGHEVLNALSGLKALGASLFSSKRKGPARIVRTNRGADRLTQTRLQWAPMARAGAVNRTYRNAALLSGNAGAYGRLQQGKPNVSAQPVSVRPYSPLNLTRKLSSAAPRDQERKSAKRSGLEGPSDNGLGQIVAPLGDAWRPQVLTPRVVVAQGRRLRISALPHSIAPVVRRAENGGSENINSESARFERAAHELSSRVKTAPDALAGAMDQDAIWAGKLLDAARSDFDRAIQDFFMRQARLPPAGGMAFDPRLTPAWAGVKLPV